MKMMKMMKMMTLCSENENKTSCLQKILSMALGQASYQPMPSAVYGHMGSLMTCSAFRIQRWLCGFLRGGEGKLLCALRGLLSDFPFPCYNAMKTITYITYMTQKDLGGDEEILRRGFK